MSAVRQETARVPGAAGPPATRIVPLAALAEHGTLGFEADGTWYLVADVDGEIRAYAVVGPAAAAVDRTAVADGLVCCPLHGWPIDADEGRCAAADHCRYDPVPVVVHAGEVVVHLRSR